MRIKSSKSVRIRKVQGISVSIGNNRLVGRYDPLVHFFSVRMASLTIRPSEKGFTILYIIVASHGFCVHSKPVVCDDGCTLTLLLFLPSSSESHKTEKDKIEFLWFLNILSFIWVSLRRFLLLQISDNLYEKDNFNFLFYDFSLHRSILDKLTMIIILMIGTLHNNSCNDLWHYFIYTERGMI